MKPTNFYCTRSSRGPGREPPADILPPELWGLVFANLFAVDLGRASVVCKAWHGAASGQATSWMLAMPELDPFCALGGPPGAWRLFDSVGKCWLKVAQVLTGASRPECDKCSCKQEGSSSIHAQKPSKDTTTLCCCPTRLTRASSAASALSLTHGYRQRCPKHCLGSAGCVPLSRPLRSKWMFRRQAGIWPTPTYVKGNGSQESADALEAAFASASPYSTIIISGRFEFEDLVPIGSPDHLGGPVRVVGDGPAEIVLWGLPSVIPPGVTVFLESLSMEMKKDHDPSLDESEYTRGYPTCCIGGVLMAENVKLNCQMREALNLIQHPKLADLSDSPSHKCMAFLKGCTLSSWDHNTESTYGIGVIAESCTTLAMYDCLVQGTLYGVSAGIDGPELKERNTFQDIAIEDILELDNDQLSGQIVQPWRDAWVHRPILGD